MAVLHLHSENKLAEGRPKQPRTVRPTLIESQSLFDQQSSRPYVQMNMFKRYQNRDIHPISRQFYLHKIEIDHLILEFHVRLNCIKTKSIFENKDKLTPSPQTKKQTQR